MTDEAASVPESAHADAELELATRLAVAIGRLNRRLREPMQVPSYGMLSALSTIVRCGPLRPGDLARVEAAAAPTMTRIVAALESDGLVSREPDPADGRSQLIRATDAGRSAVIAGRRGRAQRLLASLETLDDDERHLLGSAILAIEKLAGVPGGGSAAFTHPGAVA